MNNSGQVFMAPKNSAICYFTKIQGMFRGGGEFAEVTTDLDAYGTERWVLRTGSQQNGITASARCFLFNQAQK